jgi:hypothetical protein
LTFTYHGCHRFSVTALNSLHICFSIFSHLPVTESRLTAVAGTGATVSLADYGQTAAGFTIRATNTGALASTTVTANIIAFHD